MPDHDYRLALTLIQNRIDEQLVAREHAAAELNREPDSQHWRERIAIHGYAARLLITLKDQIRHNETER